jgi:hypothetical protein
MSESAIHLVDEVLPIKPIRQWVLSFPFQLRLLLAIRPKLMAQCLHITNTCISAYLRKKAGLKKHISKTGSVTLIQRFGGSINLNVHFHQLFIDGVYELDDEQKPSRFHITEAPTKTEISEVLEKIVLRLTKLLEKQGLIVKDENFQIEISDDDSLSKLQAGSVSYRFATGPNKGKKALTLKTVSEQDHVETKGLVAKHSGFSLHAGVSVNGDERKKLEKICRYIARPAIAQERLSLNERGQVVYRLKRAYDDGTTHIIMEPLELMEKLAALVPRPKVHLTRFHGVLAPHYKYRDQIVPKPKTEKPKVDDPAHEHKPASKARMSWARLLKRVFKIDMEICQACGGKVKVISTIEDPIVIRKILSHLGLDTKPPPIWPARGPPSLPLDEYSQAPHFED